MNNDGEGKRTYRAPIQRKVNPPDATLNAGSGIDPDGEELVPHYSTALEVQGFVVEVLEGYTGQLQAYSESARGRLCLHVHNPDECVQLDRVAPAFVRKAVVYGHDIAQVQLRPQDRDGGCLFGTEHGSDKPIGRYVVHVEVDINDKYPRYHFYSQGIVMNVIYHSKHEP